METETKDANQQVIKRGLATYDHIQLSEEETAEALRQGRMKKDAELKMIEYRKKLQRGYEPVKMDEEKFRRYLSVEFPEIDQQTQKAQFDFLLKYFTGDDERGLLLFGGVGCGKTTLMRVFQANPKASYGVHPCARFAEMFAKKDGGFEAIKPFYQLGHGMRNEFNHDTYGICFDDLGEESNKKHFGNDANVMETIILARYDRKETWKYTHITTNLTADQIEEIYGKRVRSRMREMFIAVDFKGVTDLRK